MLLEFVNNCNAIFIRSKCQTCSSPVAHLGITKELLENKIADFENQLKTSSSVERIKEERDSMLTLLAKKEYFDSCTPFADKIQSHIKIKQEVISNPMSEPLKNSFDSGFGTFGTVYIY